MKIGNETISALNEMMRDVVQCEHEQCEERRGKKECNEDRLMNKFNK